MDETVATIEAERPDRVCVEIDEGRYRFMTQNQRLGEWAQGDDLHVVDTVNACERSVETARMVPVSGEKHSLISVANGDGADEV